MMFMVKEKSMKEKVVNNIMIRINNNYDFDEVKLEEIKYGLLGLYSLITKTTVIITLSLLLGFFQKFIIFFVLYVLLRCVGFGCHAKSNIQCWMFSTILLLGIPYILSIVYINTFTQNVLWTMLFINFLIFSPADTEKRPMINKRRKLKFKIISLIICIIYLIMINNFPNISNLIIAAMLLEGLLINPLGYILMGQKVRFKLNDIYLVKQKKEGGK